MFTTIAATTLWVLFSLKTGLPAPEPNSFTKQSACSDAASAYMRLSKTNEQYRCQRLDSVVPYR